MWYKLEIEDQNDRVEQRPLEWSQAYKFNKLQHHVKFKNGQLSND